MSGERKAEGWVAGGLAAVFLGVYLRTLCPTVYLGDDGDFCTAMVTGGIPHPPGYPVFGLLGRLALLLIPVGEPAFRIGCVVALAGALTPAVLYLIARELAIARVPAVSAVSVFALAYSYWSQCVRVEVYTLHLLLVSLVLLLALRYRTGGRSRDLYALALSGSLGLSHHLTIALLVPPVLLLIGARLRQERIAALLPGLSAALLIGPSFYLLLLFWARQDPRHSWGHPDGWSALWNHASARLYRGELRLPDLPLLVTRLREAADLYRDTYPYLLWTLPLLGLGSLGRRDPLAGMALTVGVLTVGTFNLTYQIPDASGYFLVVWLLLSLLLAESFHCLTRRCPARLQTPASGLGLLFAAALLLRNWASCDLHHATWVRDLARQRLESVPENGILLCGGPDDSFPLWYVRAALRVRPDVTPVDHFEVGAGFWRYDRDPSFWYLRELAREGLPVSTASLARPEGRERAGRGQCLREIIEQSRRPVAATFAVTNALAHSQPELFPWLNEKCEMLPVGLVMHLTPRSRPVQLAQVIRRSERCWAGVTLPLLQAVRTDQEMSPDYVAQQYAYMRCNLGQLYRMAGAHESAAQIYREIAQWNPRYLRFAQGLRRER